MVDLRAARFLILLGMSQRSAVKLKEVQYFLAVCEEGTFTGAAKRCGVSRSLSNASAGAEAGGLLCHREPSPVVRLIELGRTLPPSFKKFDTALPLVCREVKVSRMAHRDILVWPPYPP